MLACARIGAIHSVVFGGFAPRELAMRIDDSAPKVIMAASCGIEVDKVIAYQPLLNDAIEIAEHTPEHVVMLQRPQALATLQPGRDVDWDTWQRQAEPVDCVPVAATDPLIRFVYLGHHGQAQGHCQRQRRSRGGACATACRRSIHCGCGRCLLGGVGCGLGGWALLHCLRASICWLHDCVVMRASPSVHS